MHLEVIYLFEIKKTRREQQRDTNQTVHLVRGKMYANWKRRKKTVGKCIEKERKRHRTCTHVIISSTVHATIWLGMRYSVRCTHNDRCVKEYCWRVVRVCVCVCVWPCCRCKCSGKYTWKTFIFQWKSSMRSLLSRNRSAWHGQHSSHSSLFPFFSTVCVVIVVGYVVSPSSHIHFFRVFSPTLWYALGCFLCVMYICFSSGFISTAFVSMSFFHG